MRYLDIIKEDEENVNPNNIFGIKQSIVDLINAMPNDKLSFRILNRVKDQLSNNNALDFVKYYSTKISELNKGDKTVQDNLELLSSVIAAAAQTTSVKDRDLFFKLWERDALIDIDAIFNTQGFAPLSKIVKNYNRSQMVKKVVNIFLKQESYGVGKGELLMSLLSKRISKATKGDLLIDGKPIEVKTASRSGGRFGDREVKPESGYLEHVQKLMYKYSEEISSFTKSTSGKGITIDNWIRIGQNIENKDEFIKDTKEILNMLFTELDNSTLLNYIKDGKQKLAKEEYANQTFNKYLMVKDIYGVLYFSLVEGKAPTFVFFSSIEDLERNNLKLHASTAYILYDNLNEIFPKIIVKNM